MGTFFFRNRPELELLTRLLQRKSRGSTVDLTILGCSKGAEVYSFTYVIHSSRPDLGLKVSAIDINPEVVQFAKQGVYSLRNKPPLDQTTSEYACPEDELAAMTFGDQATSIFERMSPKEIELMFDTTGDQVSVKAHFRGSLNWQVGDAGDVRIAERLSGQDIVVANRFLCHMQPQEAEACLRRIAKLVKPGGFLFVSGVDLDVRSKVARDQHWIPVIELIHEIHNGDPSLRKDWPLQWWGLEPFDRRRSDWNVRYASVFQIGAPVQRLSIDQSQDAVQMSCWYAKIANADTESRTDLKYDV
jgi:chemotaxis methyl-accepting protein methylase